MLEWMVEGSMGRPALRIRVVDLVVRTVGI